MEEKTKQNILQVVETIGEIAHEIDEANVPSLAIDLSAKAVDVVACAVDKKLGGECTWHHDKKDEAEK